MALDFGAWHANDNQVHARGASAHIPKGVSRNTKRGIAQYQKGHRAGAQWQKFRSRSGRNFDRAVAKNAIAHAAWYILNVFELRSYSVG